MAVDETQAGRLAIIAEWERIDSEAAGGRLQVQQELNQRQVLLTALRDRDR